MGDVAGGLTGKGSGGSSAPSAPDLTAAVEAQAAASSQATDAQTQANRVNQRNAWGSVDWSQDPTTGQWTQNVALDPQLQATLDHQQAIGGQMTGLAQDYAGQARATPLNVNQVAAGQSLSSGPIQTNLGYSSLGAMPRAQAMNEAGVNAVYNQATSRLDPQWSQKEESTRAQLAAQGLDPGTEAYDSAMGNLSRARNDAYSSALNNAVTQGAQIGSNLFNQSLAGRQQGASELTNQGNFANAAEAQRFGQNATTQQFQNTLHNQAIQDQQTAQRNPIQMAQLALAGNQVQSPQFQGFIPASNAQAPEYMNAALQQYGATMQQYGANQAAQNSKMSGAAQMAPAIMSMFSSGGGGGGGGGGGASGGTWV